MSTGATKLPKATSAIQIDTQGPDNKLTYRDDVPLPSELKPGEILVKNDYAGINYIDIYFRSGLYPLPSLPLTLGREAEGIIIAVGPNVTKDLGFHPGDRVAYTASFTFAKYTVFPADQAIALPSLETIEPGLGAASMLQGLTALTFIHEAYEAKPGDTIVVHAAAGGMGLFLTQLLNLSGASVIATASTNEKLQLAKEHGATHLINYSKEDWVARVQEITEGKGVQAVYDGVGKATFDGDLTVLARKGTLVSFGNASGPVDKFDISRLSPKNLKILRPQLSAYIETREEFIRYAEELVRLLGEGKVRALVHKVYEWEELDQAHQDLQSRGTAGKLLLRIK